MVFKKPQNTLEGFSKRDKSALSNELPEEITCPRCKKQTAADELLNRMNVCLYCGYHFRINARRRVYNLCDRDSFTETDAGLASVNSINFPGYDKKLQNARLESNETDAAVCGFGKVNGIQTGVFAMEPYFMMGSMGSVVGEKITRLFETAAEKNLPVTGFTVSGGARMQEGILSLMQMAKTSGAVKLHSDSGNLFLCVLTDPTTGGVTASFAMEADIIISEPQALIGFAGPRVIEQTIKKKLPQGFQRAEFLLEKGFVDDIVDRRNLKKYIAQVLRLHANRAGRVYTANGQDILSDAAKAQDNLANNTKTPAPAKTEQTLEAAYGHAWQQGKRNAVFTSTNPHEKVKLARAKGRSTSMDFINNIFTNFTEMRGDRSFADDKAVVAGVAFLDKTPVTVIAIEKGRTIKERSYRNFGSVLPEGYRKALRQMKLAEKFSRPVICFVDTPGAYCGIGAEERGQGHAIAANLMAMMALKTPIISILVGEGGSGGALALAVANEVWMLENAIYSIISPEGCASILWKDAAKVKEASECLKLTAGDLLESEIIEKIFPENDRIYDRLKFELTNALCAYEQSEADEITASRYERFRKMGVYKDAKLKNGKHDI